jgi:Leucine-rich repeat (LRR) protein
MINRFLLLLTFSLCTSFFAHGQMPIFKNDKYAFGDDYANPKTKFIYDKAEWEFGMNLGRAIRNNQVYYIDNEFNEYLAAENIKNITDKTHAIVLKNKNLTEIPEEVYKAKNLKILDLSGNKIKNVEPKIGTLSELIYLDLSNNQIESIAENIDKMKHLKYFKVNANKLSELPSGLSNLKNLLKIEASSNDLSKIHNGIAKLSHLEKLNFRDNPKFDFDLLCQSFKDYPKKIKFAEYEEIRLRGPHLVILIPEKQFNLKAAFKVKNLTELEISKLGPFRMTEIEINYLRNKRPFTAEEVAYYDVDDTITEPGLFIPSKYKEFFHSEEINWSKLSLEELPTDVEKFKNLKSLNLSGNQLYNLPANLSKLERLKELDLSNNKFEKIPKSVFKLKNLEKLILNDNPIDELPKNFVKLDKLKEFSMKNCPVPVLSDTVYQFIIDKELMTRNELETHNQSPEIIFANKGLNKFPNQLWNFTYIVELNLSQNEISSIPKEITLLKELSYLNLSQNKLKSLPMEIGKLELLNELLLDNNQLIVLPDEISNLKSLETLSLKNNQLTTLPKSFKKLKNLRKLELKGNEIPESELKKLKKRLPRCEITY